MVERIQIVCPFPERPIYDAIVDGERIGSWSSRGNAEDAARHWVRTHPLAPVRAANQPTYEDLVVALDTAHALLDELRDQAWDQAKIEVSQEADDKFNEIGVLIARAKGELDC